MSQIVLVTGATAGIGRATALALAARGHHVIVAARRADALDDVVAAAGPSARMDAVVMDVASEASVSAAARAVDALTGGRGVDVVINNAGYGQVGAVLDLTDEVLRAQLETNVMGVVRVTRAFTRGMIARRQGRVVNVSSIGGRVTFPLAGAYHASKYAVEALSDALRMELGPLGVDVSVIEPGAIRTSFGDVAVSGLVMPEGSAWAAIGPVASDAMAAYERYAPGPAPVVAAMVHATESTRPRPRYVAPAYNRVILAVLSLLPTRWADALMQRAYGLTSTALMSGQVAAA